MKRRLSVTNLRSENNLLTFQLNAPVIIRMKVKHSVWSRLQTEAFSRNVGKLADDLLFIFVEAN